MCFSSGGAANRIAKEQRADEVAREGRINSGMATISNLFDNNFNDAFFAKQGQAYDDWAMPQVDRQAKNAHDQLVYALARTGNLDSSAAINQNQQLTDDENQARDGVVNTGQNQEAALRSKVEGARGDLVAQLNATGDSSAASDAAMHDIADLNQPQGYSPLGNLFANFLGNVALIGSNARNGYSGFFGGGPSLFSPGTDAQRVVGG